MNSCFYSKLNNESNNVNKCYEYLLDIKEFKNFPSNESDHEYLRESQGPDLTDAECAILELLLKSELDIH